MNTFNEKVTPYLTDLASKSPAIKKMYFFDPKNENMPADINRDLLAEKANTISKGVVNKFGNRVLFLLSYTCASNCRFCERQDRVGVGLDTVGRLKIDEIDKAVKTIEENPNIKEVIFSGGDPLTNPIGLKRACNLLRNIATVKILRIHTKLPMQMPSKVNFELLEDLVNTKQTFYFSIHVNHPDELNDITLPVLQKIRKMGYIMIAQSVFLKEVNDNVEVLEKMYSTLAENGIRPYYLYHCQEIPTTKHFVIDIPKEVEIMTELREKLSGLAWPQHVIDLQGTTGKVIVPTNHWNTDLTKCKDYLGNTIMPLK
jgi:lysine 2,3-aminomutase